MGKSIRILHFSDFHLNKHKLAEAEFIIKYLKQCLTEINKVKKIDLILFSGDIIDKGGQSFGGVTNALNSFVDIVINPIITELGLPNSRFIFTPGNHDINREADSIRLEDNLERGIETWEDIINNLSKASDIDEFTKRITEYKGFEKQYYSQCTGVQYCSHTLLSTFRLSINDAVICISSLNSIWRCGFNDTNKIVIGMNQILEHTDHLQNCDLRIALTHYPIDMLKQCERDKATISIAKEFDLLCTGHAHSELIKFEGLEEDSLYLNVKSAGTLSDNIYEKDARYKNAFQIIDFESESGFRVYKYQQFNNQEFSLDKNFGKDGCKDFNLLSPLVKEQYVRAQNEEREKVKQAQFREEIFPFIPIDEFISSSGVLMTSEFISCPAIEDVKAKLTDVSNSRLRFMALSGMGKTRIIAETFSQRDNVFYSRSSECLRAIPAFIRMKSSVTLIIDNCDKDTTIRLHKLINEGDADIRVITIYNVLTPDEKSVSAPILELNYKDTEGVVDAMIERDESLRERPEIKEAIRDRCGGIPYMALLMIKAYKENQNLNIENTNDILTILLNGGGPIEDVTSRSMEAISLFEPLGYAGNYSDEFNWICNTPVIHHIYQDEKIVKQSLKDTVRDFQRRQLIEEDGPCIRIRPRPLAEWLAERWLITNGDCIPDVFDALNSTEDSLKQRLTAALSRRFQEMKDSAYARQLYSQLNNVPTGSFHNERVAFTDVGSRLLLSMSEVSPENVASNIFSLLNRNSTEWINDNIKYETRRNLIYALERTVVSRDAFKVSALALAKLANAENEEFGNNSKGIFSQLFHVVLSGTTATLEDRFSVIAYLKDNLEVNADLVLTALNSALQSRGFTRVYSGTKNEAEYTPTYEEIGKYWTKSIGLLKEIASKNLEMLDKVADIFSEHAFDLSTSNKNLLFDAIEFIANLKGYDWPSMRKSLSHIYHWEESAKDAELLDRLSYWMKKLMPQSFFGQLKVHLQDLYNSRKDYSDFADEAKFILKEMEPFAEKFIQNKIYNSQEFLDICTDNTYDYHWLVNCLYKYLNDKQIAQQLVEGLSEVVNQLKKDAESALILMLLAHVTDELSLVGLRNGWYSDGRYKMAASLSGIIETKSESQYNHILEGYLTGNYDDYCFNNYLRYNEKHREISGGINFMEQMYEDGINKNSIVFPYLIHRVRFHLRDIEERLLIRIEKLLLDFEFSDDNTSLNREIVSVIGDLLEERERPQFAIDVHHLVVKTVSTHYLINNPFEHIYSSLLPKYEHILLPSILDDLAAEDERMLFYYAMRMSLGAGFGSGAGPLFQCNVERIKELCLEKSSQTLTIRLANMCPVYEYSKEGEIIGLSNFFIWLCDNFGENKDMLNSFSSNVGTFSYCGNEISAMFSSRIPLFEPLLSHRKEEVRIWAEKQIQSLKAQHDYEKGNEDYRKAIYGKQ
ncbi:metallophosphoesterase [Bacteroides caecimuris]|uniref:metallophosphoesterase n=1 Tax=Bacteroides caecimuris TaxID=1796613 RepID=UPI0024332EF4|nr:metallophosphoesterase [Bacteroides caecimuris]